MMNFIIKSSLEDISLIKIASVLWNQHDIRPLLVKFSNSTSFPRIDKECFLISTQPTKRRRKWQEIEHKVIEKVSHLAIRTSLKDKILDCIQLVGFEILRWLEYHHGSCNFDLNLITKEFYWTSQGIDKKKTAETLIRDESIDIATRYKLACMYCLEDDIPKLWNIIPENDKESFYSEEDPSKILQHKLVVFWTYTIKKEVNKIGESTGRSLNQRCSPHRYAFRCAAISGNKVAVEYFFQKLKNKKLIIKTAFHLIKKHIRDTRKFTNPPCEYYTEVLFFLLSQMKSEQQMEVLKLCAYDMLRCCLSWPYQRFFVEIASHVWGFLTGLLPDSLLRLIFHKIIFDYKDYNYERMFEELWQQLSSLHKSNFITDSSIAGLVYMISQIKDKRKVTIFKLIFQGLTIDEKNELIFSERGQRIWKGLIDENEWDLLKFFVQTSKDEMIAFKQKFEEYMQTKLQSYSGDKYTEIKNKCDEFSLILDDFVREHDKRKSVDESDSIPPKKLCISED